MLIADTGLSERAKRFCAEHNIRDTTAFTPRSLAQLSVVLDNELYEEIAAFMRMYAQVATERPAQQFSQHMTAPCDFSFAAIRDVLVSLGFDVLEMKIDNLNPYPDRACIEVRVQTFGPVQ